MDSSKPIHKRHGARLPHWSQPGATYATTFRLSDSLPAHAAERLAAERRDLERELKMTGKLETEDDTARFEWLCSERVDAWLNQSHGNCVLRQNDAARCVQGALEFFAGKRYENLAWCVMPNHVHWMLRPQPDWSLPEIMDSVKTFTARTINKLTGRTGNSLWMREYYDHLIRDSHDFLHAVRYIVANPAEAGIVNWPWVYFDPQLSSVI